MWKLEELAKLVNGQLIFPAGECVPPEISGAAPVATALSGQITFVTSAQYLAAFDQGPASAAIVVPGLSTATKPTIVVAHPEAAFAEVVSLFRAPVVRANAGISPQAIISGSAKIADDACIYPGAVIMDNVEIGFGSVIYPNVTIMENCRIGAHTQIFPNVVLYENSEVGDRCLIHSGVVLGAYGFGYSTAGGQHKLSPQLGNVVIESDVEIGANTTIDRGTYDSTVIARGTKIDDLVMVGHNCRVGQHNLLCSQVGIAGSCQTGDYVVMGGQVGLADHLHIGHHAMIGAKSGLMHDVEPRQRMFGIPARPAREEMQLQASRAKLPEMRKQIRDLQRQLSELTALVQSQQPAHPRLHDAA